MAGSVNVGIAGGADSSSVLPIGVSKKFVNYSYYVSMCVRNNMCTLIAISRLQYILI